MPARATPVRERTVLGRAEHVIEAGTTSASSSTLPAKKQGKRQAQSTIHGPSPPKKLRRISSTAKEKPSPSTRKQPIRNAGKAPTTVLAPEAQDSLVGSVSCEEQPTAAESGNPDSLPIVGGHGSPTVVVPVSAGPSNLEVPKRRPGRPKKIVDPGVLRSAAPSQRKPIKRSAKHGDNNGCQLQWKVITTPKPSEDKDQGLHNVIVEHSENDSELRPRVWASCKEDLLHVIPELSKTVNGLSWKSLETPMMLLSDQVSVTWGAEAQTLMTSVDLSITQEYLYSAKSLPTSPPQSCVVPVLKPEDEPMTLIQDINSDMGDLFSVPDLLGVDEALVTVEESAQEVFYGDILSGVRMLVKNYMPGALPVSSLAGPEMIANQAAGDHKALIGFHQGVGASVNAPSKEDPPSVGTITKKTSSELLSAPYPVHLESWVIAGELTDTQQQAPAGSSQEMETSTNSPTKEMSTPAAKSYMSELSPLPLPVDSKSEAIVEGAAKHQPIPAGLPQDIETLVNAYIRGIPVVLIAPREKLPIVLHQDYGWVILGFYQIGAVTEEVVPQETREKGPCATRFNWRFRLKWSPGGEYLLANNTDTVLRPWWRRDSHPLQQQEITTVSTEHYQKRRDEHTTAYPQFGDVGQKYDCLIPLHLLHMPGQVDDDTSFPSGWFCMSCGRLNPQDYFRHRICSSKSCKGKPLGRGYALELQKIRQPQDAMPFAAPLQCPPLASVHIDDGGTTTYDYSSVLAVPILIQHVFTHNRSSLQQDATRVFRDIQTDVLLVQGSLGDAHFSYVVGADFLDLGVKTRCWSEASDTVRGEAERLSRLAEPRGDFKRSRFSPDVTVIAWPTAGTTKKTLVLKARENAICVQCMGNSALISLRALPMPEAAVDIQEIDSTSPQTRKVPTRKGKSKQDHASGSSWMQASGNPQREKEKCEHESLSVSLVHGDILVICGHDVELKVKRNNATTVLIIVNVPLRSGRGVVPC